MAKVLSIRIGKKYVKICELQYRNNNGSVYVNRILKAKTPEGVVDDGFILDFFAAETFLGSIIRENNMTATDVIFSISSSKIATKEITSPIMKEKDLTEMIDANASEYFPVYLEDYILAHNVLDKGNPKKGFNQMRVSVYAAPKDLIDDYFKLAERLKLNIKSIDYAGNSAYQMIRKQIGPETSLVVQIQEESTTVNILTNNILKLQRVIPYGKNQPIEALARLLRVEEDEAATLLETENYIHETFDGDPVTESLKHLINNVLRVVDYYNSRNADEPIEKAYLVGESVSLLGIDYLFANEFDVSVAQINRFHGVKLENENDLLHKIVTKYVGCLGAGIESVNFMPQETLDKIKNINSFRMLKIGLLGAAAISFVACMIPITQLVIETANKDSLQDKIDNDLSPIYAVVDEYYRTYDIFSDAVAFKSLTDSNNDSLYEFIKQVEASQPTDVSITNVTFNNGQVSINGSTSVKATIAKYIVELKKMSNVSDVYVSSFSEQINEDGVVSTSFTLACQFYKLPDYISNIDSIIEQGLTNYDMIIDGIKNDTPIEDEIIDDVVDEDDKSDDSISDEVPEE